MNQSPPTPGLVRRYSVKRFEDGAEQRVVDTVASEEPLEIRVSHWFKDVLQSQSLAVTMRTPGNDRELAAGLLLSEGVIQTPSDIADLRALGPEPSNEILVELSRAVDFEAWRMARAGFVSSSCGVCGKRSREAILASIPAREPDAFRITASLIDALPSQLRETQQGFAQTGGLHAAALIDTSGAIQAVFEDIGRHNALDKLIGDALLRGAIPVRDRVLFLSSRSSFELVQKTAMAGAPVLATVGGPSSLAIESARECGITLIGFVRGSRFNVYSGDWRVSL